MFSQFLNFFNRTAQYYIYGSEYRTFVIGLGGMTFGKGLFTVIERGDIGYWTDNITRAFPEYRNKFELFGYDWMGRCFAVDSSRNSEEKILVFDPGTLEVSEIPLSFMDFVNKAIPLNTNDCLMSDNFINWYNETGTELEYMQCVSYKRPLFLGGVDEPGNLTLDDMDEYWHSIGRTAIKMRKVQEQEPELPAELADLLTDDNGEPDEDSPDAEEEPADNADSEFAEKISDIPEEMIQEEDIQDSDCDDFTDSDLLAVYDENAGQSESDKPDASNVFDDFEGFDDFDEKTGTDDEYYAQQADEAEAFFHHQQKRAEYIRRNTDRYLEKFKKMERKNSSVSWNWCGFLFNTEWLLYRKMYGLFVLFLLLPAVASYMAGVGMGYGLAAVAGMDIMLISSMSSLASGLIYLIFMFIVGMFGNSWYSKKLDKLVAAGEAAESDEAYEKIYKKGGTNLVALIIWLVLCGAATAGLVIMVGMVGIAM